MSQKKTIKFYRRMTYDFGNDDISEKFEFVTEKDEEYYETLATKLIELYDGNTNKQTIDLVVKLLKDEVIDEDYSFECVETEMLEHYKDQAIESFREINEFERDTLGYVGMSEKDFWWGAKWLLKKSLW